MNIVTLITQIASHAKYPLLFLLFFVDGSSTNFISSTIAATGVLNIWIIWTAAIVIEICVDLFYYFLGTRLSEKQISEKVAKGEGNKFINTLDEAYKKHPGITLMIVKFLGPFAIPGIMYMGKVRALNTGEFIGYGSIVAVTRATLLSFLGYMVGKGIKRFMRLYDLIKVLGIILIVIVVLYIFYKMYQKQIEEWFMKIFKKIK